MIVGVDCGLRKITLFSEAGGVHLELTRGFARENELRMLRTDFIATLMKWTGGFEAQIERIYMEDAIVAGARNLRTSLGIAQTVGAVLSIGYPTTLVPVATWKKAVVGSGNAKKEDVAAWFKAQYPADTHDNQDIADAAAIYNYGLLDMDVSRRLRPGDHAR